MFASPQNSLSLLALFAGGVGENYCIMFCCYSSVIVSPFSTIAFEIINFLPLFHSKHFSCFHYKKELATAFRSLTSGLTLGKPVV